MKRMIPSSKLTIKNDKLTAMEGIYDSEGNQIGGGEGGIPNPIRQDLNLSSQEIASYSLNFLSNEEGEVASIQANYREDDNLPVMQLSGYGFNFDDDVHIDTKLEVPTIQAESLTDGTTTKTMTEVLAGGTEVEANVSEQLENAGELVNLKIGQYVYSGPKFTLDNNNVWAFTYTSPFQLSEFEIRQLKAQYRNNGLVAINVSTLNYGASFGMGCISYSSDPNFSIQCCLPYYDGTKNSIITQIHVALNTFECTDIEGNVITLSGDDWEIYPLH